MNEVIGYVDTRAAEVATTAIASDVAQVHQDMLDADADASAAAASAAAAAGTLANAVKKTGEASQSITGDIAVAGDLSAGGDLSVTGDAAAVNVTSTGTLYANDASVGGNLGVGGSTNVGDLTATGNVSVPTPTGNNYAANKKYVDDADALKLNITDVNSYAVGLTGNQGPVTGTKSFRDIIVGLASLGNGSSSESITVGSYKSILRINRTYLNTFRGVMSIISCERANGKNPELVQIGMHGNTAVSINRYSISGTTTCDYFVSADNDYVYIGIKSRVSNLNDNAKQMIVLTVVGFNSLTAVEAYNGTIAATPDGSLIGETS